MSPSWLDYQPSGLGLDVEIFPFDSIRQRGTPAQIAAPHRYGFYMLICITEGAITQLVDFEPIACRPGSFLTIRPGQVHSFGTGSGWEGWLVLFRTEFLALVTEISSVLTAVSLDQMSDHIMLQTSDFEPVAECVARMGQDAAGAAPSEKLHALLRHQLYALLLRLTLVQEQLDSAFVGKSRSLRRFMRFRRLLDQKFMDWHQVADYARALACTEKSLARAALNATGKGAKELIAVRIALEAKRRLAHGDEPVYLIAESLGFPEPTNFAKFFRRETGCSPLQFRRRQHLIQAG